LSEENPENSLGLQIKDPFTRFLLRVNALMFTTLLISVPLYYSLIQYGRHDEIVLLTITIGLFMGGFIQLFLDKLKNVIIPFVRSK